MEKTFILKLQVFTFIMAASSACFGPFLPVYFNSRNLSFTQIGVAFAVSAIIGVIAQPIWGYLSDRYLKKKKTLVIAILVNMIIISFFIKASSFNAVITLIIFNNMFMSGIAPIIDAYTFDVIEERQCISYSNFRFMASAAWGITNLILGYVIKEYGINSSIILYEILAASGLLLLYRMKYAGRQSHQKVEFRDIKLIFKNKKLMLFFFTIFLMNSAFVGGVNYMNELVKYAGGDVSKLGIVWFVTCTFEVLTFFVTVRLISKFGVVNIYIFSIIVYGSKFILDFIVRNATFIIAIQVLEGVAFTLFIASTLEYLSIKTDAKVRATAMSTYAASGGLGAFSSSLAGGILLNKINPSQLYGILGVLCFAALIFVVVMEKTNNAYDGS